MDVKNYEPHLAAVAELGVKHVLGNVWTSNKDYYVEQFGQLCEMAQQYGMDVNVEFVTWASINNLQQAVELLRAVNMPNVGIVVDALHFTALEFSILSLKICQESGFVLCICATVRKKSQQTRQA